MPASRRTNNTAKTRPLPTNNRNRNRSHSRSNRNRSRKTKGDPNPNPQPDADADHAETDANADAEPFIVGYVRNSRGLPENEAPLEEPYRGLFKHENNIAPGHMYLRTSNHFSFVKRGTHTMVQWEGGSKPTGGIDMIAWVAPLCGGRRKGLRCLSGYTPIYMDESNPSVWEMPGLFARVEVKWPLQREKADIFGHSFDGVYIRNEDDTVSYLLQHPDPEYKHIFEQTVESRNQRLKTTSRHLIHFESVDLKKPCPWWMELWVIRMLRLEHHEPPDVPGDEGYDRVATAPTPGGSTISTGGSEYGSEAGEECSDAESIIDVLNISELPNSTSWNWHTKTSRHWDTVEESFGQGATVGFDHGITHKGPTPVTSPSLPPLSRIPTPGFRTPTPGVI